MIVWTVMFVLSYWYYMFMLQSGQKISYLSKQYYYIICMYSFMHQKVLFILNGTICSNENRNSCSFFSIFITRYCICSRMDRNVLYKCLNNTCKRDYITQTGQNILVVCNKSLIVST